MMPSTVRDDAPASQATADADRYRSVLIVPNAQIQAALPAIAERLKRRHGSRLVLAVVTQQEKTHYAETWPGLFDAIETMHFRYRSVLEPMDSEARWFAEAHALERRFAFSFAQLLMDDRHFGIGFSPGGTNYPESRWSRAATYAKAVRSYVLFVRWFIDLIEAHRMTLVLNAPKACCVVARALGIPIRFFTAACFKNYWTWTDNEYMESAMLAAAYQAGEGAGDERLTGHYDIYLTTRAGMFRRFRTGTMVRNASAALLRYPYYHLRRYEKRIGMRPFAYANAHYRIWSGYRALKRQRLWRLDELAGTPLVYFPLSVEPEVTLTRESPEFNHQPFAIHAIAKSLPVGTRLAVKEHVLSIGTRPRDFYRDLAKIPNVVLLDPSEWGLDVIRRARAIATISGTSGFEAAVLGVPVLAFSVHARYTLMPHVRVVRGWHDVAPAVTEVLAASADERGAIFRKAAGDCYLAALVATSVDCGKTDLGKSISPELLDAIVPLLERSLSGSRKAEQAAVAGAR